MKKTFRQRTWQTGKWFILVFFLLLLLRLGYGYLNTETSYNYEQENNFFSNVENMKRNYASEANQAKLSTNTLTSIASAQKYEKTATVRSKSTQFDTDAGKINSTTKDFEGIIQYEQNTGNKGSRELHLMIGVNPEKFDSFYSKIQAIGKIRSTEITKIDKTNEYQKLNAKKASLDKTLASLNELKSRSGAIADYVRLHDKILEIETQLQELGVELGNFDAEHEFCTVKFSLYEGAAEKGISFAGRLKVAFEWTVKFYTMLVLAFLGTVIVSFLLLLLIDKLKLIKLVTNKLNE